jgi:hypothetical protein
MNMANMNSGMKDVLSKVRVPRRTKEAVALNKAFEPTATAIMYWDEVKAELERRNVGYQKALEEFRSQGGIAEGMEDDVKMRLGDIEVIYRCDPKGNVLAIDMHVPLDDGIMDRLTLLSNGQTAVWGLSKNEQAMEMVKQLRDWVETDGVLKGQHHLVNTAILDNPLLTAAAMIPDDTKGGGKKAEKD